MAKLQGRIRYEENWNGRGEYFVYETKWSNEKEWGLDTAFNLLDYGEEKGAVVRYEAVTKIREWMRQGVEVHFGK